ncbi:four helix bundle protein [Formosa sp. 4Alg 33]|uniref:four helix bundle protein n=1 Tax=Formosa sp. 4Alg 33 TaxID=3382189 RepID=UPI003D9C0389
MNHKDLDVWKESMVLVTQIYQVTNHFPKSEVYGLTSQMRRCAVSIPSNIAEGSGRNGFKELYQFIGIAMGSASELETQVLIAIQLEFIEKEAAIFLELQIESVKKLLVGYRNYVKRRLE